MALKMKPTAREKKAASDKSRGVPNFFDNTMIFVKSLDQITNVGNFERIWIDYEGSKYLCCKCNHPLADYDSYYLDFEENTLYCEKCFGNVYPSLSESDKDTTSLTPVSLIPLYSEMSPYEKTLPFANDVISEDDLIYDKDYDVLLHKRNYKVVPCAEYLKQRRKAEETRREAEETVKETNVPSRSHFSAIPHYFEKACGLGETFIPD